MIKIFNEINAEVYKNISTTGMYIIVDFDSKNENLSIPHSVWFILNMAKMSDMMRNTLH